MWSPILTMCRNPADIVLVTTNYDRAIELASNMEGMPLDDGFVEIERDAATWSGFE